VRPLSVHGGGQGVGRGWGGCESHAPEWAVFVHELNMITLIRCPDVKKKKKKKKKTSLFIKRKTHHVPNFRLNN